MQRALGGSGRLAQATAPARPTRPVKWRNAAVAGLYLLSVCVAAPAAARGIPLVRDTEIEKLLKDYSRPIFKAAGLESRITMRIVKHESFNAFVIDGGNVFINTGTLLQAKTPNEVIGVIAHETGHIAGGHLASRRTQIARDQTRQLLLMALGIVAMAGGAAAGGDTARELGGLGTGVMLGGQDMIRRGLLRMARGQESAADQAALRYLEITGQSGRGMLKTFERFAREEQYIPDGHKSPYMRSHPMASDRIARLAELVERSRYADVPDPPELQRRHDMVRAKVSGYLESPAQVFRRYKASDNSLPARYARAIARNCSGFCDQAMAEVDALIRERPDNPYFRETKGAFYLKSGKHREAIPPLRKALQLAGGNASLIQVQLAQAMLGTQDDAVLDEAIALLKRAIATDRTHAMSHHLLATAYARKGQYPQAELAAAQAHFAGGNIKEAHRFAKRAVTKLRRGSPEWLRADDIIKYNVPKN